MATQMTFAEASKIMNDNPNSQLVLVQSKQHVKLPFKYIGSVTTGVSEMLKSNMLFYNKELDGVPVAFRNIKALQRVGRIVADQTCLHFDIEADFILFKPTLGCVLKGVVNKVGKKHVGCLVLGCFNGWFPRDDVQQETVDDLMGQEVEFQVQETFSNNRVVSLKGRFQKLVAAPGSAKKAKKKKQKEQTAEAENDSIIEQTPQMVDESLHIDPLMTSTPAVHVKKPKKHKKPKHADTTLDSEKEADVSNRISNIDPVSSEDTVTKNEKDNSLTQKKKKKKSKTKEKVNIKKEDVSVDLNMPKQSKTQTKTKSDRKRKVTDDVTEAKDSGEELVSPKKRVKKERKEAPVPDSRTNDSNNNVKTHKKSKKRKSK